jgi:hypothetical protein
MSNTFVAIQTVTVGSGGTTNIDFTSIPATYTDLLLKLSGRSSRSGTEMEEFRLTFNGNGSNYSERQLRGNGTTAVVQAFSGASIQQLGQPAATASASVFGNWDIYIPNYAGSNNKSHLLDGVTENNASAAYAYLEAGLWADTAAITSIRITAGSYLAVEHTTATLYGIKST